MAKVKISREEIEKMLKDQLRTQEVLWDKKGNATVEVELQKLTEKDTTKFYPIYVRPCNPVWTPTWTSTSNIKLCYSSGTAGNATTSTGM